MPVRVIIDCDPGVDDVLALLLALASPELLIVAIVTCHGNGSLAMSTTNLIKTFYALEKHLERNPRDRPKWPGVDMELREQFGLGKILVLEGAAGPIEGQAVTAQYFHGRDSLSDITTRHPDLTPPPRVEHPFFELSPQPAHSSLPGILASHPPNTVAYLALGPLTNLAELHLLPTSPSSPSSLLESFAVILVMGGALDVPGNTTPVSEFNVYADPYAASLVFSLELPTLYLLPLDITTPHTIPFSLYKSVVDQYFSSTSRPSMADEGGKSPIVHFTSAFLERVIEVMAYYGTDAMELHDPTAAWALIDWIRERTPDVVEPNRGRRGSYMRRRVLERGFSRSVLEEYINRRASLTEDGAGASAAATAAAAATGRRGSEVPLESVEEAADHENDDARSFAETDVETLVGIDGGGGEPIEWQGQFAEEYQQQQEEQEEELDLDEDFASGWIWQRRVFEVETDGTKTRGMFIIDRRQSASTVQQSANVNRSNAYSEDSAVSAHLAALALGSSTSSSTSTTDTDADTVLEKPRGVKVIISTPGVDTLRALMLERIWGISIGLA